MAPLSDDVVMTDDVVVVANNDDVYDDVLEEDEYLSDNSLVSKPKYPNLRTSFETAIVITNLPRVSQAKVDKLTKVVTKLVSRIGTLASSSLEEDESFSGVELPFDEDSGMTCGFAFVEFRTAEEASQAVEVLQNYK